ncbi:MAG: dihydropteroate synthase [candidate division Zixibacteria bacterium]|nr:dihydropteroate synthase [candidate division Zixibacteria bacterium]
MPLPRNRQLEMRKPMVMGILNVTPDSFSDGGRYAELDAAVERACRIIEERGDIIDIGGESSRPGSEPVALKDELERVIPVVLAVRKISEIPISIDTTKAEVARQAIEAGADIINDISALRFDAQMAEVAMESGVPVILMHMRGLPKTMQVDPIYENCVAEIKDFFRERLEQCRRYGIEREKIILDPGIGFGKRLEDNLAILRHIAEFKETGCPIMVGTSRKSFIGHITGGANEAEERIGGSIASALVALMGGADIIRVHDVAATVEAIKVWKALQESE